MNNRKLSGFNMVMRPAHPCPGENPCCLNHSPGMPGSKHKLCICHDPHCICHSQQRYEWELDKGGKHGVE